LFTIRVVTKGCKSQKNSREREFRLANHKIFNALKTPDDQDKCWSS